MNGMKEAILNKTEKLCSLLNDVGAEISSRIEVAL